MQYCHNCGKKMMQSSLKFCPFCGTNLNSLSAKPPEEVQVKKPIDSRSSFTPFANRGGDDDDEDSYIDNMQRLDVRISALDVEYAPMQKNRETIGGLMTQGPTNEEGRGRSTLSEKEILDNFQREGSALRPVVKSRQNDTNEE